MRREIFIKAREESTQKINDFIVDILLSMRPKYTADMHFQGNFVICINPQEEKKVYAHLKLDL